MASSTVTSITNGWQFSSGLPPTDWYMPQTTNVQWMVLDDASLKAKIKEAVMEMLGEMMLKEDGLVPGSDAPKQSGIDSSEGV